MEIINYMIEEYYNSVEDIKWVPTDMTNNIWESDWPYSFIDFDIDFNVMYEEIRSLEETYFIKHRDKDKHNSYFHEGWNAVTLHGIDPSKTENYDRYGFKSEEEANYHWTEVCEFLPNTVNFLKSLNYEKYGRVRIMKLNAGGYVMPHTDGVGRIFGPFNIAINNPKGCSFIFKNEGIVPFKTGRGVFLDLGREHAVWNNSNEDRYHIIVHGDINSELIDKSITLTYNNLNENNK
jgi:hypothetical protein